MRRGPICAKCGKPLRKGQGIQVILFATYGGLTKGLATIKPWLQVQGCMSHEPKELREALLAEIRQTGEGGRR